MYHCNLHFYLVGSYSKAFETVKGISPLSHFTHAFVESDELDQDFIAGADVIYSRFTRIGCTRVLKIISYI